MIKKITLGNFASYKEPPAIETNAYANFFYGLNGTGKTVLTSYMENKNDPKYKNFSMEGGDKSEIIVYNSNFVERNFYEKDTMKGIFTIGEGNQDATKTIEKAKGIISRIDRSKDQKKKRS